MHVQTHQSVSSPTPFAIDAKTLAPGVYFNLPMAAYHADPSLGSTDLKSLLVHPAAYWRRSHMNPNRIDDSDTPAKKMGRALHSLVLEGETAFAKAFIEEPSPRLSPAASSALTTCATTVAGGCSKALERPKPRWQRPSRRTTRACRSGTTSKRCST